ncbi:MAG: DNA polymerase III subunit beta [Alphaproteobacteria bacterium]|nr:MAG: DNA polymerase III subunit beta [Alphaproteobacteria bacterium]
MSEPAVKEQVAPEISNVTLDFSVSQKTLEKALSFVGGVMTKKNLVPILSHIKIIVGEKITMTATNMDLVIKETFDAEIKEKGVVCAPASLLHDIVKKVDRDDRVHCCLRKGILYIKTKKSEFRIPTMEATQFPDISEMPFDKVITMKAPELLDLLKNVSFNMSTNEARYILNGVYFHQNEEKSVTCVATDFHRLAYAKSKQTFSETFTPCVIGKTTVQELEKVLEDSDQEVEIHISEARIQFEIISNGIKVVLGSRLLEGNYPDYQKVIMKNHPNMAIVSADPFKTALERIALVLSETECHVSLNFEADQLTLKAKSQHLGAAEESLSVEYKGEPLKIVININYIMDITRYVKDAEFKFFMKGNYDSLIVESKHAQYFIMPLIH